MKTIIQKTGLSLFLFASLFAGNITKWSILDSLNGKFYKNGKIFTGSVVAKLESGKMEGEFKDGLRHGLWQTFNLTGEPLLKGNYINGKKDGLWEQWYENMEKELAIY